MILKQTCVKKSKRTIFQHQCSKWIWFLLRHQINNQLWNVHRGVVVNRVRWHVLCGGFNSYLWYLIFHFYNVSTLDSVWKQELNWYVCCIETFKYLKYVLSLLQRQVYSGLCNFHRDVLVKTVSLHVSCGGFNSYLWNIIFHFYSASTSVWLRTRILILLWKNQISIFIVSKYYSLFVEHDQKCNDWIRNKISSYIQKYL